MKARLALAVSVLSPALLLGCAAANRSYAPTASYSDADPREIDDEDILKAYASKPQVNLPARIAWYNLSPDGLADSLQILEDGRIAGHYAIPKELIEGRASGFPPHRRWGGHSSPISLKTLRLFGARAQCDLLILSSSRFEATQESSLLVLANMLVLPYWWLPTTKVSHSFDAALYIFDIRNGYLYRDIQWSDRGEELWLPVARIEAEAEKERIRLAGEAACHLRSELAKFLAAPGG